MLPEFANRLETLRQGREGFLALVRGGSLPQRRYRPFPNSWSMLDVTEHLVLVEEKSLLGMLKGPPAGTTVTPIARVRMGIVRLVMKSELRIKVPVARVVPQGSATLEELEPRWSASWHGLEAFLAPISRADAGAARFRHPIAGWVGASEGVAFLVDHIGHHTRQLARIRRSAGFPSA